jgi:hypothetical protein
LVSFVPPLSGLATLHLVVKMAEDLISTIQLLSVNDRLETSRHDGEETDGTLRGSSQAGWQGGSPLPAEAKRNLESRVLRILRANPTPPGRWSEIGLD